MNDENPVTAELNRVLDMLDETLTRVDVSGAAEVDKEYISSGIRTAKHHLFQAMREVI